LTASSALQSHFEVRNGPRDGAGFEVPRFASDGDCRVRRTDPAQPQIHKTL
jgi:hypothetical protein